MSKAKKVGLWISLGLASLAFAAAGLAKLAGVEQMHMSFAAMGLPAWFGAIYFHLVYDGVANAVPALVLALLVAYIFVTRKGQSNAGIS